MPVSCWDSFCHHKEVTSSPSWKHGGSCKGMLKVRVSALFRYSDQVNGMRVGKQECEVFGYLRWGYEGHYKIS